MIIPLAIPNVQQSPVVVSLFLDDLYEMLGVAILSDFISTSPYGPVVFSYTPLSHIILLA